MENKEFAAKIAKLYLSNDETNHALADTLLLGETAQYIEKQAWELSKAICEFYYTSPEFLSPFKNATNLAKEIAVDFYSTYGNSRSEYILLPTIDFDATIFAAYPAIITPTLPLFWDIPLDEAKNNGWQKVRHKILLNHIESGNFDFTISTCEVKPILRTDNLDKLIQRLIKIKSQTVAEHISYMHSKPLFYIPF